MKTFTQFIAETGKAHVERRSATRGTSSDKVEYAAVGANGKDIHVSKTKREAQRWVDMETMSREDMWKKYPELKDKN